MLKVDHFDQVLSISITKKVANKDIAHVKLYYVDGLLLNTGPPGMGEEVADALAGRKVRMIINTHDHPTAIGNNAYLQRTFSAPIRAHKQVLEGVRYPHQNVISRFVWGRLQPSKVSKIQNSVQVGERYFRVLETPGRYPGHICLFEPERKWLFSGDLLIESNRKTEDEQRLEKDLRRVLALEPDTVFCGRNGILEGGIALIEARLHSPKLDERFGHNEFPSAQLGDV
ncbi:MAG: MBL fold metallo-hydrolase [Candidatus Saccharibacteria bacterium]